MNCHKSSYFQMNNSFGLKGFIFIMSLQEYKAVGIHAF